MSDRMNAPESLEYRTEVKQLLDILAHSLYTDREIFSARVDLKRVGCTEPLAV